MNTAKKTEAILLKIIMAAPFLFLGYMCMWAWKHGANEGYCIYSTLSNLLAILICLMKIEINKK